MWPRVAEIILAVWLLVSPWVLLDNGLTRVGYANQIICGLAIIFLSTVSFWLRLGRAHIVEIPIGFWIIGSTYFSVSTSAFSASSKQLASGSFLVELRNHSESGEFASQFMANVEYERRERLVELLCNGERRARRRVILA
jgi:hypothetical protein